MKKFNKILSLSLIMFIMLGMCSACTFLDSFRGSDNQSSEIDVLELQPSLVPMAQVPAVSFILSPVASGNRVEKNSKVQIDYSNTADGYIMVKWLSQTTRQLRVLVTGPTDVTYTYTIWPNDTFEVFPLSDGNGSYTAKVYEQTDSGKYAQAGSLKFSVTLKDEFAPFLRPNQFVDFNEKSKVVVKASELVAGKTGLTDKIAAVYSFVTSYLSYDTDFANEVIGGGHKGYFPDLEEVYQRRKGVCFDYASMMTAMLRSQSIPTKLVIGYAGDIKHAWINVYSKETGWIDKVIFFDGKSWLLMDPTFASSSNSAATRAFIGDGANYTEMNLY